MARATRTENVAEAQVDAANSPGNSGAEEQKRAEAVSEVNKKQDKEPDFAKVAEASGRPEAEVRQQWLMSNDYVKHAEGTPPKMGREGGVIEDGTGDFAPTAGVIDLDRESRRASAPGNDPEPAKLEAPEGFMVVVDSNGQETIDEIGVDGVNPVSTQNPPPKAIRL